MIPAQEGIEARQIKVSYGGVLALNDVSLTAKVGQVTGLIGPNGVGKTTLFNTCSGLLRPTAGRVLFNGKDITSLSRPRRAQRGLGRSSKEPSCSTRSLCGRTSPSAAKPVGPAVARYDSSHRRRATSRQSEKRSMRPCSWPESKTWPTTSGTAHHGPAPAGRTGPVLAGKFSLIMLDEPSAGLDNDETARMARTPATGR